MNSIKMHDVSILGKGCKPISLRSHTSCRRFSKLFLIQTLKIPRTTFSYIAEFQTIQNSTIPAHTWNDAEALEKFDGNEVVQYHRMDILWPYM